jgi:hypothetical protein
MMTLLEIAKAVAVETGVEIPVTVTGDDPDAIKIVRFVNETGAELARRVDWHVMRQQFTVTGDGTNRLYPLADDHSRLAQGLSVTVGGVPVRGSISADEWFSLVHAQGTPRYFWLAGLSMGFYPYPAAAQDLSISYQSTDWAQDLNGNGKTSLSADNDAVRLPGELFIRGAVWRWMRHVSRDFSDQMAEFEGMLTDYASAEGGMRQP